MRRELSVIRQFAQTISYKLLNYGKSYINCTDHSRRHSARIVCTIYIRFAIIQKFLKFNLSPQRHSARIVTLLHTEPRLFNGALLQKRPIISNDTLLHTEPRLFNGALLQKTFSIYIILYKLLRRELSVQFI